MVFHLSNKLHRKISQRARWVELQAAIFRDVNEFLQIFNVAASSFLNDFGFKVSKPSQSNDLVVIERFFNNGFDDLVHHDFRLIAWDIQFFSNNCSKLSFTNLRKWEINAITTRFNHTNVKIVQYECPSRSVFHRQSRTTVAHSGDTGDDCGSY
jgi:hypothetical protein